MAPDIPITMNADEFGRMISQYVRVGYSMAVKTYVPAGDKLRRAEVEDWLRIAGYGLYEFKRLVEAGDIKTYRLGTGKNSPIYYSKSDINEAMAAYKTREIKRRNQHK